MALSDLTVFSEYAYSSMTETIAQEVQKFNAASNGAITLRTQGHEGDYSDQAMYAKISGLVRRRNAYGTGAVAAKQLTHLVDTSVKVAAGTPPVDIDPGMFRWIQRSPEEGGVVIGAQLAEDMLADMLNTAFAAAVPTLKANAGVYTDVSAGATTSLGALNTAVAKFGDRSQSVVAWIMHSKSLFDIYGDALTNTNRLFQFGNVRVIEDGFGRPIVVTDSPALTYTDVGTVYASMGLTPGAILVDQNGDYDSNVQTSNGDENINRTWQAEWSYNLGIKGYSWDKTNGGVSPNDTALATASNWDKYATSDKDTAGVLLQAD